VRGRYFESEAKKYNFKAINTDDDFEEKINMLVDHMYMERKELKQKEREHEINI
jgi:hypothetical protein